MSDADLRADLSEFIEAGGGDGPPLEPMPVAMTPELADRILRRIGRATEEMAARAALVAEEKARLDEWLEDRNAGAARVIDQARHSLETFARMEHERSDGRKVTWDLPHGVLRLRDSRERLVVDDEAAAVAVLRDTDLADKVLTLRLISKSALREVTKPGPAVVSGGFQGAEVVYERVVTGDGELVPGVHFERNLKRSFTVTPSKRHAQPVPLPVTPSE